MNVSLVRINAYVWACVKSVASAEDFATEDRVVRTWMRENGVHEGDRVQPIYVEIDGVDSPVAVWVVIARSGLVCSVSEPPVGRSLASGPTLVNLRTQTS